MATQKNLRMIKYIFGFLIIIITHHGLYLWVSQDSMIKSDNYQLKYDSLDRVNKDYSLINVYLRNLISDEAEEKLKNDTAYINLSSKYN